MYTNTINHDASSTFCKYLNNESHTQSTVVLQLAFAHLESTSPVRSKPHSDLHMECNSQLGI